MIFSQALFLFHNFLLDLFYVLLLEHNDLLQHPFYKIITSLPNPRDLPHLLSVIFLVTEYAPGPGELIKH